MDTPRTLIDAGTIAARIDALAKRIATTMPEDFVMVVILNGAFMFAADLSRALARAGRHPTMEFINLKSYGDATESAGQVRVLGTAAEWFDPRDPRDVARVIAGAATERDRLAADGAAARAALARYGWDEVARRYLAVFTRLVTG